MFSERPPRRLRNRGPVREMTTSPGAALAAEATLHRPAAVAVAERTDEPRDEPRLVMWMLPVMFAIAGTAAYLYWPFEPESAPREWRTPDGGRGWGGGGGFFGARMAQAVEDYFALPADQRVQYIDQQIDAQEVRMAELKREAQSSGMSASTAELDWQQRRSDRIGMVLASLAATDRDRFDTYLGAMADRRKSRGLAPWYDADIAAASEKAAVAQMAAAATQPTAAAGPAPQ
jgi:hypothetical protein